MQFLLFPEVSSHLVRDTGPLLWWQFLTAILAGCDRGLTGGGHTGGGFIGGFMQEGVEAFAVFCVLVDVAHRPFAFLGAGLHLLSVKPLSCGHVCAWH